MFIFMMQNASTLNSPENIILSIFDLYRTFSHFRYIGYRYGTVSLAHRLKIRYRIPSHCQNFISSYCSRTLNLICIEIKLSFVFIYFFYFIFIYFLLLCRITMAAPMLQTLLKRVIGVNSRNFNHFVRHTGEFKIYTVHLSF